MTQFLVTLFVLCGSNLENVHKYEHSFSTQVEASAFVDLSWKEQSKLPSGCHLAGAKTSHNLPKGQE